MRPTFTFDWTKISRTVPTMVVVVVIEYQFSVDGREDARYRVVKFYCTKDRWKIQNFFVPSTLTSGNYCVFVSVYDVEE